MQNNNRVAFYTNQNLKLSTEILDYIVNGYCVDLEMNTCSLDYWSEHVKDGTLYRAHIDYRKQGPWYDWVMIRWEPDKKLSNQSKKDKSAILIIKKENLTNNSFFIVPDSY